MKLLIFLILISFHSFADEIEPNWDKVYEYEWDKISDIMRWYWGGYNANIPVKSFDGEDFLMSDAEIKTFCKQNIKGTCLYAWGSNM